LLEWHLRIKEKSLERDHPSLIPPLKELIQVHLDKNEKVSAERLLDRLLALQEKNLPAKHPDLLKTATQLAKLYEANKSPEQAQALLVCVINIRLNRVDWQGHGIVKIKLQNGHNCWIISCACHNPCPTPWEGEYQG